MGDVVIEVLRFLVGYFLGEEVIGVKVEVWEILWIFFVFWGGVLVGGREG